MPPMQTLHPAEKSPPFGVSRNARVKGLSARHLGFKFLLAIKIFLDSSKDSFNYALIYYILQLLSRSSSISLDMPLAFTPRYIHFDFSGYWSVAVPWGFLGYGGLDSS